MSRSTANSAFRWLRHLTVSLAVLAGTAQAASYNAIWDPPFGAPFAGLGWRGVGTGFSVPDSCEPTGAGIFVTASCDGQVRVTSSRVELYDDNDPYDPTIATLNFDPASFLVVAIRYAAAGRPTQLWAVSTDFINPEEDLSAFGVSDTTAFNLSFTFGIPGFYDGPHLGWIDCGGHDKKGCAYGFNSGADGFRPTLFINRVPEPASLWLASLALLGIAVSSKRQSRRLRND